jgi:integrase
LTWTPARVTVRGQLQRLGGAWVRTATKAARKFDTLAIGAPSVAALRDHQRRMAAERTPEWRYFGLVFATPRGEPITAHVLLRAFHEACDKAGIARRRFHDLRGSSASELEELGVAEDVRMNRLGHATKRMARRYAKGSETQDRAAVDLLEEALGA